MKSIPQNTPVQPTLFASSESDMVTCLICGKQLQLVSTWHLKMHGLTCSDYKAMFPGVSFIGQAYRNRQRTIMTDSNRLSVVSTRRKRTGIMKNCETCDKPFYVMPCDIHDARFCSYRCRGKELTKSRKTPPLRCGSDNPQWRGGRDKNYYGPNWHSQRRLARQRDNHTCQKCGKTEQENGRKLDVHHITDFREFGLERYQEANQLDNLITLCRCCHSQITGRTTA